ncbi:hypothetical protein ARNL5_03862 [Anaerolineae bacterium]|nr:hypothetical protein ARNL5_03862 [Anaerolineae bacterium]
MGETVSWIITIDCSYSTIMTQIYGLYHVKRLSAEALPKYKAVWSHTHGNFNKFWKADLPFSLGVCWTRYKTNRVFLGKLDFSIPLHSNDALVIRNKTSKNI